MATTKYLWRLKWQHRAEFECYTNVSRLWRRYEGITLRFNEKTMPYPKLSKELSECGMALFYIKGQWLEITRIWVNPDGTEKETLMDRPD